MSSDSNPKDFLNKMLLTGNITFDGKHLLLMGRPGLLLNADILVSLYGYLLKYDKNVLFNAGVKSINDIIIDYKNRFSDINKIFSLLSEIVETSGLGEFDFVFEKSNSILRANNSIIPIRDLTLFGKSDKPVCFFLAGMFYQSLKIVFNKDYKVEEVTCIAKGDNICTFLAKEI